MAAIDDDVSFRSLEYCFEKLENVLNCAGNPSKKLREDARTAFGLNRVARNNSFGIKSNVSSPHFINKGIAHLFVTAHESGLRLEEEKINYRLL
ncbi:hypothetical protein TNIN_424891 [Trichonephila inaurata madagascariensis]|uniref:Uncharacterized protein n=1 Tax=Trichonephila inaurata madagascariensis TaxID=2747483 RepID=A0A8X7CSY0_9ARAC|nr:hypothetical protein TNIN_424891 [Trichonephila inaurata madagascariensis]